MYIYFILLSHYPCFHATLGIVHLLAYCTIIHILLLLCVHISFSGLLNAVNNLRSESLGQVIRLTWDAPFTLDITGVNPDIWYCVDITVNNDPFNNSSDSIPFNTYFVNTPEFNFTNNGANTSVIYQFRVTPINGAGNGTTSAPVTGYFSGRELLLLLLLTTLRKNYNKVV